MNFRNDSQIKTIYKELSKLSDLLLVWETKTNTDDFVLTKPEVAAALKNLSTGIDTLDRKWVKKEVVEDIDKKVAEMVRRYNLAKTRVKAYYKTMDFSSTDRYMTKFDVKSSNEVEISNDSQTQKVFAKKRVNAIVKEAVTLGLVIAMLGGTVFGGVKLHNAIQDRDQAAAQVEQLQADNADLELKVAELLVKISVLEEQLANNGLLTDAERAQLKAEIEGYKSQLADIIAENSALKDDNQALRDENARLEDRIKLLQSDLKKSNALVEALKKQLAANPNSAELKQQLADALAENAVLKAQNEELLLENEELKSQLVTLNSSYNTLKAENDKLDSQNSALLQENAALKTKVNDLSDEIDRLEAIIDELNIEIGDLTSALNAANAKIKEYEDLIAKGGLSAEQKAAYEAQIKTLKENNASLEEQLLKKTNDYNTLLTQYGSVVAEKDALLAENGALKSENAELAAQVNENKDLVNFINNYYLETMGHAGNGLTALEKLTGLFGYFIENKPTSEDYLKLEAVYSFLTQIYGPSDIVYGNLTLDEFRAVLDQIAGGLQAQPGDGPSGTVNEGNENQNGNNNGNNNGSQSGGKEEVIEDTAGRLPGDE